MVANPNKDHERLQHQPLGLALHHEPATRAPQAVTISPLGQHRPRPQARPDSPAGQLDRAPESTLAGEALDLVERVPGRERVEQVHDVDVRLVFEEGLALLARWRRLGVVLVCSRSALVNQLSLVSVMR